MASGGRKRKIELEESEPSVKLKTHRSALNSPENSSSPANSDNSTCESVSSGDILASCCSSSRSSRHELAKEAPKFADLEENAVTAKHLATSAGDSVDFRDRREKMTSPSGEVEAESGELESTEAMMPRQPNPRRFSTAEKMPTEAELEDFFAAAEKNIQKQFIDKYNFDIVKDEPLEGRYEWVPVELKP